MIVSKASHGFGRNPMLSNDAIIAPRNKNHGTEGFAVASNMIEVIQVKARSAFVCLVSINAAIMFLFRLIVFVYH